MDFPEDNTCHSSPHPVMGLCLNEPVYTLLVEGGGWLAKLCEEHFNEQMNEWSRIARRQAKRMEPVVHDDQRERLGDIFVRN